jgi:hypothetical protein
MLPKVTQDGGIHELTRMLQELHCGSKSLLCLCVAGYLDPYYVQFNELTIASGTNTSQSS